MDGINYSIETIKELVKEEPFPYVCLSNFLKPEVYEMLCSQFRNALVNDQFGNLGAYDATGYVLPEIGASSFFYSKNWINFVGKIFNLSLNGKTDASFHHHKIGSKSGWIHNDLHTVYIKDNRNEQGIAPWRQDTDYWGGSCGTPGSKRRMTFMLFLNNEPWQDGNNGELGFYNNLEYSSLFLKIPPVNNSALFFQCAENSWHAYIGDNKKERNSAIQFFLGD